MEKVKRLYSKFMEMDRRKKVLSISVFLFIFVMFWAFISAGVITSNFNRDKVKGASDEQKVDAKGIIITETKEGQKYFEIYGETGNYSNDNSIATLNNVIGNFYKNNEVAMSFQSSKGEYDEKTGVITLHENTYIVLKDGVSLKTDKLIWSGSDKDTIAEGNVVIQKSKDMTSVANKCIIGPDYQKFKIIGRTKTSVWKRK